MSVYEVVFKGGHLLEVTASDWVMDASNILYFSTGGHTVAVVNMADMLYFEYKEAA